MPNQLVHTSSSAKPLLEGKVGLTSGNIRQIYNFILPKLLSRSSTVDKINAKYYDLIEQLYYNNNLGENNIDLTYDPKFRGTNKEIGSKTANILPDIHTTFLNIFIYFFSSSLPEPRFAALFKVAREEIVANVKSGANTIPFTYYRPTTVIAKDTDPLFISFLEYIYSTYLSGRTGGEPASNEIREEWKAIGDYLDLVTTGKVTRKKIKDKSQFIDDLRIEVDRSDYPNFLSSLRLKIKELPDNTFRKNLEDYVKIDGQASKENTRIAIRKISEYLWDIFYTSLEADPKYPEIADKRSATGIKIEDFIDDILEALKVAVEKIKTKSDFTRRTKFELNEKQYPDFINRINLIIKEPGLLPDSQIKQNLVSYTTEPKDKPKALRDDYRISFSKIIAFLWDILYSAENSAPEFERNEITAIRIEDMLEKIYDDIKAKTEKVETSTRFENVKQFTEFLKSKKLEKYISTERRNELIGKLKINAIDTVFSTLVLDITKQVQTKLEKEPKFKALKTEEQNKKIAQEVNVILKDVFKDVSEPNKWKDISKEGFSRVLQAIVSGATILTALGLGHTYAKASEYGKTVSTGSRSLISNIKNFMDIKSGKLSSTALKKLTK